MSLFKEARVHRSRIRKKRNKSRRKYSRHRRKYSPPRRKYSRNRKVNMKGGMKGHTDKESPEGRLEAERRKQEEIAAEEAKVDELLAKVRAERALLAKKKSELAAKRLEAGNADLEAKLVAEDVRLRELKALEEVQRLVEDAPKISGISDKVVAHLAGLGDYRALDAESDDDGDSF